MGFNLVLSHTSKWFHANQLILNVGKTIIVRFTCTKLSYYPLHIEYASKLLTEVFLVCKRIITLRGCDMKLRYSLNCMPPILQLEDYFMFQILMPFGMYILLIFIL